jgi:hypothetical protein
MHRGWCLHQHNVYVNAILRISIALSTNIVLLLFTAPTMFDQLMASRYTLQCMTLQAPIRNVVPRNCGDRPACVLECGHNVQGGFGEGLSIYM